VNFCLNPPHLLSDLAEIRYEKSAHNDVEHRVKFICCVSNTFLLIRLLTLVLPIHSFTSVCFLSCIIYSLCK